ncbi:MAG: MATE family efflux transporter [Calditrichae bacterium]|nr:MATE family efflux transporter [Calditrichota bacterium]MCB9058343.1 MATE family efflux transporter [Calditrichia bacterium]
MNKQILRLAIPNIISNLAVPLLGIVDTALVGRMEGLDHIGAVAIGGMIFNFVYWGFGFLRMGTTGLTAQSYGRTEKQEIIHTLIRSIAVALIAGLLIIFLQKLIAFVSFNLINASQSVEESAHVYFNIRIYAAPATLTLYAFHGWFLGMQNARYPLFLTILTNLANIGFNLFFIKVHGMKSDGIALGTVFAQYFGLIFAILLFLFSYRSYITVINKQALLHLERLKQFLNLNSDIFIRTLLLIFAFSFFTAQSAKLGDDILAANSILMQLWMVFSFGIDGFAFSAESIVGKYKGASDMQNLKKAIHYIFIWGVSLGAVFSIFFGFSDRWLLSLFTNKYFLINLSLVYMPWTIIAPLINSFCYLWDGIYIGATASKAMRNAMLFSTLIVFLPVFYIGMYFWQNHGIWLALLVFMLTRWFSLHFLAKKYIFT